MPENDDPGMIGGDTVTEMTSQSWLSRIMGSLMGVLIGFLLIPASGIGLWWNEGRAVQTARSLAEGAGAVVEAGVERIDQANEGKLVHVSGPLKAGGPLRDAEFGVELEAVRLVRKVEMYQWKEEKHEETRNRLGGGQETVTTYKYVKVWDDDPIDSTRFREGRGHQNPAMPRRSSDIVLASAGLGAFTVPQELLRQLDHDRKLDLDADAVQRIGRSLRRPASSADGSVFVGNDPSSPQIGDLRIGYTYAAVQPVSVIAGQSGAVLTPYQTRAGDRLHMLSAGNVAAAQMFKEAADANAILTWILRGVGAVVMFIGFTMILRPLSVLASVLPFLGDIVGAGAGLVGLVMTALLAPAVIGMAWLYYRPLVGIAILAAGAAMAFAFGWIARRRTASRGPAPVPSAGPVTR